MTFRCLNAFALALFVVMPALGQEKSWPVERGASREPAPYVLDLDAVKKLPAEYLTDYPAAYLYASTNYRIEADGTVECTTHEVIRLNNRKGIDQIGEHRNVSYTPTYERLTLNEARVIRSARRITNVEARNVQLRDVQTDYSVYDPSKELIISFPGLEIGDIIEVRWTTRGKNPEYAGQFFSRYQFGDERYPIWQEHFSVTQPQGKVLRYALTNPGLLANPKLTPEQLESKGERSLIWRVADRRPIVKEDRLPPKDELRPGVAISTFPTWDAVADWERKARVDCETCTPELKEIVRRVKQEHKTPEAIARELTHWVRSNIRYVSTGDRHDFTPHDPAFVYKNRFGDCKDGVQFLHVMLREAGIGSGSVSLSPVGDGQIIAEVPSPWSTHAILHVPIGGKDHWVDTTAHRAGWDFLPYSDCDRICYIVDDSTFRMTRTPKFKPDDNRTESVTKMTFDADGCSHNVRTIDYFGEAALLKRDEWLDVSAKERVRLIRGELLDSHSRAKLTSVDIDDKSFRSYDEPVRLQMRFDVPNHLHGAGEMQGSISDNALWSTLLGITIDPERESALELSKPFEFKHRFIIDAPAGHVFEDLPKDEEVKSKWGSFTLTAKAEKKNKRWIIDYHTRLEQTRVAKADLLEFRQFQEAVQGAFHVEITAKPIADN
jgi:transglutaminase-like putative cysteine protease